MNSLLLLIYFRNRIVAINFLYWLILLDLIHQLFVVFLYLHFQYHLLYEYEYSLYQNTYNKSEWYPIDLCSQGFFQKASITFGLVCLVVLPFYFK